MKRKLFLTAAALLCAMNITACGGRRDEQGARLPETTAATVRDTVRTETKKQSRVGEDVSEMASDAVQEASKVASDAVAKGKELVTDAASDIKDAVEDRKGDGEYNADDNGRVHEDDTAAVTTAE